MILFYILYIYLNAGGQHHPPPHHIMTCGTTAIGSKTTAGSSSCTSQEAWLVAHASLQDYHHSWYIFSCPPTTTTSHPLIRSLLPPSQEVRHRLVKGEPLGRGTPILRRQKVSFISPPSSSQAHTDTHAEDDTENIMQENVHGAQQITS